MNVTSGIVKNRSKQAPWLRESYDYGWKEEWKRLPCNNCRGSSWVAFRRVEMPSSTTAWPAVGNRSTEPLPADRTQLEVAHFPSPRSSVACSIGSPTCAWSFSQAASADALAHEDARSPHPRRIAGDGFSERLFPQARPAQKEPSAYFDQIYVAHCRATTSP